MIKMVEKIKNKKEEILSFDLIVLDTSILIENKFSKMLENKEIKIKEKIIIPEVVYFEIENMANQKEMKSNFAMNEINNIVSFCEKNDLEFEIFPQKIDPKQLYYGKKGYNDNLIREVAYIKSATLLTYDKVQNEIAKSRGIKSILLKRDKMQNNSFLNDFFKDDTLSIHFKENIVPYVKKGRPGDILIENFGNKIYNKKDMEEVISKILYEVEIMENSFIEIDREGSTILQLGLFRIVILKVPFANTYEVTVVKPLRKLEIKDYSISEKLKERLQKTAEGILIAGKPGMGKTTFTQALINLYLINQKVIKTIEAPRDLQVPASVTQMALSKGSIEEIHDILLLSRPDFTIFDEMRNTIDFKLYGDMRLSGVGMIGVMHATKAIDAIHRFIGRIELGLIPHIVDTVVFIENGDISQILSLEMTVGVPSGMADSDLARPVIIIRDFETEKELYEIYTFGEETVVADLSKSNVKNKKEDPMVNLAKEKVTDFFKMYSKDVTVEFKGAKRFIVYVPKSIKGKIIGRNGENIEKIEKELGISIDVKLINENEESVTKDNMSFFEYKITSSSIMLYLPKDIALKDVEIRIDDETIGSYFVSKDGTVKIRRKSSVSKIIEKVLRDNKDRIKFFY
ncbi:MAG: ATPase, T2SS/T4P/T4SS family [Candidatus Nanoarchaeia archaeon]|nr:ATPase, T2SS/T4P/T4SS family [Candidatus Nanoarchaeia archaeon]